MAGSYEVATDALNNHARTLSGLAGELRSALDTASGVTMTADAYGQIGQRFAAAIDALGRAGQDALLDGVDALEAAMTALRDTVAEYDQQDQDGVGRLAGVGDPIAPPSLPNADAVAGAGGLTS
jgi:uncharacterized protein YukE